MSSPNALPRAASGRTALEVARDGAQEAGTLALARFRQPQEVGVKGRGNLVTETDLEVEKNLTEELTREFPEHRVLSEETAADTDTAGWVWVIDPIDGTRNFVSGIPFFCVNIALCHDGLPVLAVTHDPNHGETFWAVRGGGAWVNDQPVRASDEPTVQASVLGVDLGYDDQRGQAMLQLVRLLHPGLQCVRTPGSAALGLAYSACARFGLFIHNDLAPWDVAAALLLVPEAGGTITDRDGKPATLRSRAVVAGGLQVHADYMRWFRDHESQLDPLAEE